jgi:ferritin-like metal-binding protein YciE
MSVDTIERLFLEELKDLHSAETQITKALPKMAKAASSTELRAAFEHHLKETEGHVQRLDKIFDSLGVSSGRKTCEGMKGVLEEGSQMLRETEEGEVRDEALISAAQRVEHYEMAAYGTARAFARRLGRHEAALLLDETLSEERAADQKLTQLAESDINQAAPAHGAAAMR